MVEDLPGLPLLLVLVAFAPAIVLWRRTRVLTRNVEDPALPERLVTEQRHIGAFMFMALAALVVASPRAIFWTGPLLLFGYVVGSYPLRKALYKDTWSLAGYLSFMGRVSLAVWGFWIVLAALPYLVSAAGRFDWMVAAVLAAILFAWNARYGDTLRWLFRSQPLTDAALLERFTRIIERSSVPAPRFEVIPLGGGAISNAIALPQLRGSSVLFTETLLAQLDTDEITAICAHEVAHLEHHTPRYLRRLNAVNIATILAAALLGLIPDVAGFTSTLLLSAVWLVLLVSVIAWRARDRQKNETASDLRAVALRGDAEALVRGLTKLYTFARVPRRMDAESERHATHPSLARRIRDIRAAAGAAPAALGEASTFTAIDGRSAVTFDADRLHVSEGDVATHSLAYSQFSELRLQVNSAGATSVVALERGGRKWQVAVAPADVARLQAVLDIVDGRLSDAPAAPAPNFGRIARVVAGFAAGIAFSMMQFALAIAALLALFQPTRPLLAAAATASLATAVVSFRTFSMFAFEVGIGLAAIFVAIGAGLIAAAYSRRHDHVSQPALAAVAVLAIAAVCASALLVLNGLAPVSLHQAARQMPAAAVFLLATSAALASLPTRAVRYASAPLAVAGLVVLIAGSTWFLERFGRDPFLGETVPLTWKTVSGRLQGELPVPFYISSLDVAPEGRALIVTRARDDDGTPEWHVGRPDVRLVRVDADEAMFVNDERVLAAETRGDVLELRVFRIDAPGEIEWQQRVPGVPNGTLSFAPATARWKVTAADEGSVVQVEGQVGSPAMTETRWPIARGGVVVLAAVSGEAAIVMETGFAQSFLHRRGFWQLLLLMPGGHLESRFSRVTKTAHEPLGVTRFQAHCASKAAGGERLLCSAYDGSRTRFASVDAATGAIRPLASLDGHFVWLSSSATGWLSGWADSQAVAIHPATREALRMAPGGERLTHLATTGEIVAAASFAGGETTIRVYARDEGRRASR